jgi:TonB family protein
MLDATSLGMRAATIALSVSAHGAVALWVVHGGEPIDASQIATPGLAEIAAPDVQALEMSAGEPARAGENGRLSSQMKHAVRRHAVTPTDPTVPQVTSVTPAAESAVAPTPAVVAAFAPVEPRFVLSVASARGVTNPVTSVRATGPGPLDDGAGAVPGSMVDAPASLVSGAAPAYTAEAQAAGVEADVPLEIVVDERGNVTEARILRRVGYGLDQVAERSVRAYRFEPARRAGHPVATRMRWVVQFQLR